ncbi:MAG: hypothetical protein DSY82_08485 [Flavobacteriia bacterium]|nr:MAG: hypothetical protein DSY82_08485 [Flavobacteriia bacterium]
MYFKHPEILYALFVLIIPVIIHLFRLQRFEKVSFTNVKLLKQIEQESRKSATLKKWLILLTRLLMLAALILAFAQPFFAKEQNKKNAETYIYLDNSMSMLIKGEKGSLLQSSIKDLIDNFKNKSQKITLITNDKVYKNISVGEELLNIEPTPFQKDLKQVLLQIHSTSGDKNSTGKNILLISDFQGKTGKDLETDSINKYFLIHLKPVKAQNIFIDSIWISNKDNENISLKTRIRNFNTPDKDVNISLYINNVLEGKTSILSKKEESKEVVFTIGNEKNIQGKISIDAPDLQFDNTRFFSFNTPQRTRVLVIGKNDPFLNKIYDDETFTYSHRSLKTLDYSLINNQDLIILNRIEKIGKPLTESLKAYIRQDANLVIIPAVNIDMISYNKLFTVLNLGMIKEKISKKKLITKINYKNPFFKSVFQKQIRNFQYPYTNISYNTKINQGSNLLLYEDQKGFITRKRLSNSNIYWISSPLLSETTNFINSPLIIPVFYNFSLKNLTKEGLYFEIGKDNIFEVSASLKNNEVLHLVNDELDFIPRQEQKYDKVIIRTKDKPSKPGIYQVKKQDQIIKNIAYNYSGFESILQYASAKEITKNNDHVTVYNDLNSAFKHINEQNKTKDLWQLFLIFALIFLIIEILLQRLL